MGLWEGQIWGERHNAGSLCTALRAFSPAMCWWVRASVPLHVLASVPGRLLLPHQNSICLLKGPFCESVPSPLIPICSSFCFVHIRDLARITEPLPYCAPEGAPEVRTECHPSLKPCICEFLTLQCPPHSGDSTRDCLGTWVDSWLYCLFPGIWEPTLGCSPCLHGPRCLSLSNGRDLSLPAAECLPEEPALKEDPESRG